MFKEKKHVGRPSNDEIKRRRTKKLILVGIPMILIVIVIALVASGSLSKLMGNSVVNEEYYCEDASYQLQGNECVKATIKKAGLYADVNSDDIIDDKDLNILNDYVKDNSSVSLNQLQLKVADINTDGMINELDVQILENYFTKVSGSGSSYSERIGIERVCEDEYTLKRNQCVGVETVPAKIKVNTQKTEDESIGSNVNNSNENTNNENTNNENINNENKNVDNSKSGDSTESEQTNQTATTPVVVTLKPQDNSTNLKVNTTYKINVNFDIKDNSKQYYYIWTNYLYGEKNYSTECKPVKQGEHGGSFTVVGTRKVNVTVYSDSSCTTAVNSTDSKVYTCDGCQNMVDVKFKPANSKTTLPYNTKYRLNVKFDVKDTSKQYYYIWSAYLNGEKNYETKCTKVTQGEHGGSITINGKRIVSLTVYSDSQCKNKIKSFNSKQYVCSDCDKSVDVTLRPQDKSTSIKYGTNYKMDVIFNINDTSKPYYYIWHDFKNGTKKDQTTCKKVTQGAHPGAFFIDGTKKIQVMIYSDSTCKKKIKTVSSSTYRCSDCTPLTISIGKNLSTSQTKNSVIHNGIKFNLIDQAAPTYYYLWRTYTDGANTYTSDCQKVVYGKELVKDLTINGTRKGTITVYTDNKCKNRLNSVPIAETSTYTCSNCYEPPAPTYSSGSDWSNFWNSSSSGGSAWYPIQDNSGSSIKQGKVTYHSYKACTSLESYKSSSKECVRTVQVCPNKLYSNSSMQDLGSHCSEYIKSTNYERGKYNCNHLKGGGWYLSGKYCERTVSKVNKTTTRKASCKSGFTLNNSGYCVAS